MVDFIILWLAMYGVWPIAHPNHEMTSILSILDIAIHIAAITALVLRWRIVRRDLHPGLTCSEAQEVIDNYREMSN